MAFCAQCGNELVDDDAFCGQCGARAPEASPVPPSEPRRPGRPLIAAVAFGIAFVTAIAAALGVLLLMRVVGGPVKASAAQSAPRSATVTVTVTTTEAVTAPAGSTTVTEKSWNLEYVSDDSIHVVTADGEESLVSADVGFWAGPWAEWSPDRRYVVLIGTGRADWAYEMGLTLIEAETGRVIYDDDEDGYGMIGFLGWKKDSSGFQFEDYNGDYALEVDVATGSERQAARSDALAPREGGMDATAEVPSAMRTAILDTLPAEMKRGDGAMNVDHAATSPDGTKMVAAITVRYSARPDGIITMTADNVTHQAVYLADADGTDVELLGEGIAPVFVETQETVSVPAPAPAPVVTKTITRSVPLPTQLSRDPDVIGTNAVLALVFALAFGFASTLFNSTIKENDAEIAGLLGPLARLRARLAERAKARPGWRRAAEGFGIVALSGLAYSFLDPRFGPSLYGLGVFVSLALAVGVVTYAYEGTQAFIASKRYGAPAGVVVYPAALLIAVACVVVSRLTGFQPGYLWGFVGGMAFLGNAEPDDAGRSRLALTASLVLLVVSMGAWFLSVPVTAAIEGGAAWLGIVADVCAGVFVAGLEGLLFGLVPLSFMDGEKILRAGKAVWLVLYGGVVFLFWHALLNPGSAYLDAMGGTGVRLAVVMLVFFVFLTAGAFWYFKLVRKLLGAPAAVASA